MNFVNNFRGLSSELIEELRQTLEGMSFDEEARDEIKELTDTLRSNLDKVVQHGRRADAIVKNMLLHSRESSGSIGASTSMQSLTIASISPGTVRERRSKASISTSSDRLTQPPARPTSFRRTLRGRF